MYELWDMVSGNIIGAFASEAEAIAVVQAAIAKHGPDAVADWAMASSDAEDDAGTVSEAVMVQATGSPGLGLTRYDQAIVWG